MAADSPVLWLESAVIQLREELQQANHALMRVQGEVQASQRQPQRNMFFVAKTTSTISALSGSTAGSGTVDIYKRTTTADELMVIGPSYKVYNAVATSIDTSTWVMIHQDAGGDWWITVEDCG